MKRCVECGTNVRPIRDDGTCFPCHIRGIGFTFRGGAMDGRQGWGITEREFLAEHVGDVHRDGIEKVDA